MSTASSASSSSSMGLLFLFGAWLISLVAVMVTLYSSLILGMEPCYLCWYQRICIYPLALILGVALYRSDLNIAPYAIPLAFLGGALALYQYAEQMIPNFAPLGVCGAGPSCSLIHVQWFGFVTYPLLSFVGAMAIVICLSLAKAQD